MPGIRVLVGTRKGAFLLTADGHRRDWQVTDPLFGVWEVLHVQGSPADPDRLYASQSTGWFGQIMQRSDDGGASWRPVGNDFTYDGDPGTRLDDDGSSRPLSFTRVWHLQPTADDPDTVHAGVEDAALFRTTDGGTTWTELSGLRHHGDSEHWAPGVGGLCLHTILAQPGGNGAMLVAISSAGVFRSEDAGQTWEPSNRGLSSTFLPDPEAEIGHRVHKLASHPGRPDVVDMQKHWDVMRSDDGGRPGTRSAATSRPTSGSPSTSTRTSRTPSTSCRSPATGCTTRRTAACGSTAAEPAGTSGSR